MREVACLFVKPPLPSVAATLQLQPCAAGDAYTCFSLGTLRGHQRKKTGLWEPLFGSFRMWLSGVAVANSLFSPADCRLALLFHSNNRNVQKPVGNFRFYHAFICQAETWQERTQERVSIHALSLVLSNSKHLQQRGLRPNGATRIESRSPTLSGKNSII